MAAPKPADIRTEARTLFLSGIACPEIAKKLGCHLQTVRAWSSKEKWSIARKEVKTIAGATVREVAKNGLQRTSAEARVIASNAVMAQLKAIEANPGVDSLGNTKEGQGSASVLKTIVETAAQVYGWNDEKTVGLVVVDDLRVFDQKREKAVEAIEVTAETSPK